MKKTLLLICLILTFTLTGCLSMPTTLQETQNLNAQEKITGSTYNVTFYDNDAYAYMESSGNTISIRQSLNIYADEVEETDVDFVSSIMQITIDGVPVTSRGGTVLIVDESLESDIEMSSDTTINEVITEDTKPVVVILQTQTGQPISAYSGEAVYWEVCEGMPKTVKVYIDGKVLYIHNGNFQITNTTLL